MHRRGRGQISWIPVRDRAGAPCRASRAERGPERSEEEHMRSQRFLTMLAATVLTVGVFSGCEQGPMEKAGGGANR